MEEQDAAVLDLVQRFVQVLGFADIPADHMIISVSFHRVDNPAVSVAVALEILNASIGRTQPAGCIVIPQGFVQRFLPASQGTVDGLIVPASQLQMPVGMRSDFTARVQHALPHLPVFFFQAACINQREERHDDALFLAQFHVPLNPFRSAFVAVVHRDGDLFNVPVSVIEDKFLQELLIAFRTGISRDRAQAQQQCQALFQPSAHSLFSPL